jgi:hypothetical protein
MSLTRPSRLTPAALAARHVKALKSTGPRTARNKARAGLNALKLRQDAGRSAPVHDRLVRGGYDREEALYGQIRSHIARTLGASTPEQQRSCGSLAKRSGAWPSPPGPVAARKNKAEDSQKTKGLNLANLFPSMNCLGLQIGQFGQSGAKRRNQARSAQFCHAGTVPSPRVTLSAATAALV